MSLVIPSFTLVDGKCITTSPFSANARRATLKDGVSIAQALEDSGFAAAYVSDFNGQIDGKVVNYKTLERLATRSKLSLTYGGGVYSDDDCRMALECGAQRLAAKIDSLGDKGKIQRWIKERGASRIVVLLEIAGEKLALKDNVVGPYIFDWLNEFHADGAETFFCRRARPKDGHAEAPTDYSTFFDIMKKECPSCAVHAYDSFSSLNEIEVLLIAGAAGVVVDGFDDSGHLSLRELNRFVTLKRS